MKTFQQLFWPGMIAGVLAGLVLSMIQEISVIPLIHKAEELLGELPEEGWTRQINTYVLNSILGIG